MKVRRGFLRTSVGLVLILCSLLVASAQQTANESARIDHLLALAKLWAAVKYFHPYLAYRDDIDWDGTLVRTIPKLNAARNSAEYSTAVGAMLNELGDPVTRVLNISASAPTGSSQSGERQPTFHRNTDGVIVVKVRHYSDFQDFTGTIEKLEALKRELPTARGVVFDLRSESEPSESEQGLASYAISVSGLPAALTTVPLDMPGERRRKHMGYAPQDGSTSGDLQLRLLPSRSSTNQTFVRCERNRSRLPHRSLLGPAGHGAWSSGDGQGSDCGGRIVQR